MITSRAYSLKTRNTFGLKVEADMFIEYDNESQLIDILETETIKGKSMLHIGEGSNLLFVSEKVGIVLHSAMRFIEITKEDTDYTLLRVGAGVNWDELCFYAVNNGLYGIENLSLIPGEVGASAIQNIGAYGVEVCDVIENVETVEIEKRKKVKFSVNECEYTYRSSVFKTRCKNKYIVTAVQFKLYKNSKPKLEYADLRRRFTEDYPPTLFNIRNVIISIRESKLPDPKKIGSAGSFFKNPVINEAQFSSLSSKNNTIPHYINEDGTVKIPAAWLIEQCGMKGKEHKGAAVYEKQPLVIINKGNATGKNIVDLSCMIQDAVKSKFNIDLEPEVNFIY